MDWKEVLDKLTPLHKKMFEELMRDADHSDGGRIILTQKDEERFCYENGRAETKDRPAKPLQPIVYNKTLQGLIDCHLVLRYYLKPGMYFISPEVRWEMTEEDLAGWKRNLTINSIEFVPHYPADDGNIEYIRKKMKYDDEKL